MYVRVREDILGGEWPKGGNRRKVKPQALSAGGTLHSTTIIITNSNAIANSVVIISIITIANFLLGLVAPFPGHGRLWCRPRLQRAAPRPGQPHRDRALGSGGAKKIEPDKLILVAFVI